MARKGYGTGPFPSPTLVLSGARGHLPDTGTTGGSNMESTSERGGWVYVAGGLGAVVVSAAILFSFFTSGGGYDNTAAGLIEYAKGHSADLWTQQIIALVTPLLIGLFVAGLWARIRTAAEAYRALAMIGGTLFIAFLATGLTLWAAPLLSADELTDAAAAAYLGYDDAGWVLLGMSGVSIATMIVGVSLAARELRLVPTWAVWVSVALGVISLATVAAVGIFAWTLWLILAGGWLVITRNRHAAV